jgi:hypothetical protein
MQITSYVHFVLVLDGISLYVENKVASHDYSDHDQCTLCFPPFVSLRLSSQWLQECGGHMCLSCFRMRITYNEVCPRSGHAGSCYKQLTVDYPAHSGDRDYLILFHTASLSVSNGDK